MKYAEMLLNYWGNEKCRNAPQLLMKWKMQKCSSIIYEMIYAEMLLNYLRNDICRKASQLPMYRRSDSARHVRLSWSSVCQNDHDPVIPPSGTIMVVGQLVHCLLHTQICSCLTVSGNDIEIQFDNRQQQSSWWTGNNSMTVHPLQRILQLSGD